jgi:hypothetical protein
VFYLESIYINKKVVATVDRCGELHCKLSIIAVGWMLQANIVCYVYAITLRSYNKKKKSQPTVGFLSSHFSTNLEHCYALYAHMTITPVCGQFLSSVKDSFLQSIRLGLRISHQDTAECEKQNIITCFQFT